MPLTPYDREHLANILRDPGMDWFTAKLLRLIAKADKANRRALRRGFPVAVDAVEQHLGRDTTKEA